MGSISGQVSVINSSTHYLEFKKEFADSDLNNDYKLIKRGGEWLWGSVNFVAIIASFTVGSLTIFMSLYLLNTSSSLAKRAT